VTLRRVIANVASSVARAVERNRKNFPELEGK
jgi:hypothetical protein